MSSLNILSALIILVFQVDLDFIDGCRCSPFLKHPQEMVCLADFALVGKVLKEEKILGQQPDPYDNDTINKYTIRLIFPIKGTLGNIGSDTVVETAVKGALCGRRLTIGEKLFWSGMIYKGKKKISSCHLVLNIKSDISFEQMAYFYNTGSYSYVGNCKQKPANPIIGCRLPTDKTLRSCYHKTALCLRDPGGNWSWVNVDC